MAVIQDKDKENIKKKLDKELEGNVKLSSGSHVLFFTGLYIHSVYSSVIT